MHLDRHSSGIMEGRELGWKLSAQAQPQLIVPLTAIAETLLASRSPILVVIYWRGKGAEDVNVRVAWP